MLALFFANIFDGIILPSVVVLTCLNVGSLYQGLTQFVHLFVFWFYLGCFYLQPEEVRTILK